MTEQLSCGAERRRRSPPSPARKARSSSTRPTIAWSSGRRDRRRLAGGQACGGRHEHAHGGRRRLLYGAADRPLDRLYRADRGADRRACRRRAPIRPARVCCLRRERRLLGDITITFSRAGSDTIDGATASAICAYGYLSLESNGAAKWTIVDQAEQYWTRRHRHRRRSGQPAFGLRRERAFQRRELRLRDRPGDRWRTRRRSSLNSAFQVERQIGLNGSDDLSFKVAPDGAGLGDGARHRRRDWLCDIRRRAAYRQVRLALAMRSALAEARRSRRRNRPR